MIRRRLKRANSLSRGFDSVTLDPSLQLQRLRLALAVGSSQSLGEQDRLMVAELVRQEARATASRGSSTR